MLDYHVRQLRKAAFSAPKVPNLGRDLLALADSLERLGNIENPSVLESGLCALGTIPARWARDFTGPYPESRATVHRALRDLEAAIELLERQLDEMRVLDAEDWAWAGRMMA